MKINLSLGQKVFLVIVCFSVAIIGFMVRLPGVFRHNDKELHAAFYFLAAAFLNILFAKRNLIRHIIIFVTLYLFSMAIEFAQEYSNKFFHKRIHGRFDPEDLKWNMKGLIAFSIIWILYVAAVSIFKKSADSNNK